MKIFPFANPIEIKPTPEAPLPPRAVEWAWDFKNMTYAKKAGRQYKVYEDEAIKVWFWKLFMTERFYYPIHTFDYGNELYRLYHETYSKSYTNALAEDYVREAVKWALGDYILDLHQLYVDGYRIPFVQFADGTLYIRCAMDTIYNKGVNVNLAGSID